LKQRTQGANGTFKMCSFENVVCRFDRPNRGMSNHHSMKRTLKVVSFLSLFDHMKTILIVTTVL